MTALCDYFWGSHGCDLPADDHTLHQCGGDADPCCQYDEAADEANRVRHAYTRTGGGGWVWGDWGEYGEGWRMRAVADHLDQIEADQ